MSLAARPSGEVASGQAFAAFRFPQAPVNELISAETDEPTGYPEHMVAVRRVASGDERPR